MLLEFYFKNFRSFRDKTTFSMLAADGVRQWTVSDDIAHTTSFPSYGQDVLRVASIYGANGSGKSNVIRALAFFRQMILESVASDTIVKKYDQSKFALDDEAKTQPGEFEMIFLIGETKYRYGFELDNGCVAEEWLFRTSDNNSDETLCFERDNQEIELGEPCSNAQEIRTLTRPDALFLSTAAQFNIPVAMEIKEWFSRRFNILFVLNETTSSYTARQFLHDDRIRSGVNAFINRIDPSIESLSVTLQELDEKDAKQLSQLLKIVAPENKHETDGLKMLNVSANHKRFHDSQAIGSVNFRLSEESQGIFKLFSLLGPWLDTLGNDGVLIIDEFGASIHTQIAIELIKLFYTALNGGHAQLIVATHDTNLLRRDLLRRDQVWFTEKSPQGASDLYSLVEFVVNQADIVNTEPLFSSDYLMGKYGAIPFFGSVQDFVKAFGNE